MERHEQLCEDNLIEHRQYIVHHGQNVPETRNRRWHGSGMVTGDCM